jgi:pilus assembly protein CpaE
MAKAAKAASSAKEGPRLVACIADEVTREAASRAAAGLGWSDAKVRSGGSASAAYEIDRKRPPQLMLVDLTDATDPAAAVAELIEVCGPQTRILAIGAVNDVGLFRTLMSLGVADYLVKPVSSELLSEAFSRAMRTETDRPDEGPHSKQVNVFIGARGGVGTTTLAAATAWLMRNDYRRRVTLVDLDLHFGNLALSLDLEPGRGLREALEHPERTDNLLLASAMVKESENLSILAAEEPLEDQLQFSRDAARTLVDVLNQDYDCLIFDVPRSLDPMSRGIIGLADNVIIVTDLSLAALRDTLRLVDLAKSLCSGGNRLLVANHVGAAHRGEIGRSEFERGIGGQLDMAIPFDAKAAVATARGGRALPAAAGGSKATIELRQLASRLAGHEAKPKAGLRRWFG